MTVQKQVFIQDILNLRLIVDGKTGSIARVPRLLVVT